MNKKSSSLFFLFILCTLFFSGCSGEVEQKEEIIRPVRYQQVKKSDIKKTRSFSGVSKAATEMKLSFRISGTLETVKVKVGQKIKKAVLIASIDDTDIRIQYEEANVAMRNAEVQKDNAKANLARVKKLYENNNVPLSEYEDAKNQYAAARAEHESRIKKLDLQKSQLSYSKLFSPMAGIVAEVPVEKNENINAGQVIALLSSDKEIEVEVGIPGSYISRIKTGDTVSVAFSSLRDQSFSGTVTEVSYAASGASTYPVRVRLEKLTKDIRPGMPADVNFTFSSENEGEGDLVAPVNAVAKDQQGNYVFIVTEGSEKGFATVKKRQVRVGTLTNGGFIVLNGLKQGELVVISGVSKITDGMKVKFLK
ncbi:MAG: efflux RND transporter periplasmic adaptor subunit [Deltaproteobacteria bacterium]|nr:efflux RND transporter periplasmic adaptor subunit [Deltaproteobacteria bacterium]